MRFFRVVALTLLIGWSLRCANEAGSLTVAAGRTQPKPKPSTSQASLAQASLKDMAKIPAGSFTYGATEENFQAFMKASMVNFPGMKEALRRSFVIPPVQMDLPEFYIDQFEVTNQQYQEFVNATGYRPARVTDYLKAWDTPTKYPSWAETLPVVWIAEEDAAAYCAWRGARLPSEQEWEKAARGAEGRLFPWGDSFPRKQEINFGTEKVEPVGNRPADKSPYGVYDMGGNVAEITSSTADSPDGPGVVVRGGTFMGGSRDSMAVRRVILPRASVRSQTIGCRCARSR